MIQISDRIEGLIGNDLRASSLCLRIDLPDPVWGDHCVLMAQQTSVATRFLYC